MINMILGIRSKWIPHIYNEEDMENEKDDAERKAEIKVDMHGGQISLLSFPRIYYGSLKLS